MNALKIAIDSRMINESGIGRYISNLIRELQIVDKKNEYFILHLQNDYDKLEYQNNFHKVLADFPWYGISEQVKLPGLLKGLKPNLTHFPHFNIPIFYNGKFVVTIHDLIHQHFSMERATTHGSIVYKIRQAGYKLAFKNALAKSAKILAPSNYVKDLLNKEWKVNKEKIIVTPEAIDDKILTAVSKMKREEQEKILSKFNIKPPYIFYVGNVHPHKNVEGLIRVFGSPARLDSAQPRLVSARRTEQAGEAAPAAGKAGELRVKYPDLSLVLSGNDHYFWQRIKREYQDKDIIYTGKVSDEELAALYKNAACFVMPSLEEGFGIPILEAFACSCPVVSSNKGSLPEIGGDAAIYFDPADLEDMGNKIDQVLKSDLLRRNLIVKGKARTKDFSWERLARETLEVYQQCV